MSFKSSEIRGDSCTWALSKVACLGAARCHSRLGDKTGWRDTKGATIFTEFCKASVYNTQKPKAVISHRYSAHLELPRLSPNNSLNNSISILLHRCPKLDDIESSLIQ